jgi:C-terminal processing protease CtpA/Prc
MFLADANAISQSESILGIVEYYELGEIVGQRTAGVTGNSNPVLLPGGFSVGWTGMRVQKHNGELHQITGIAPTVPVTKTVDGLISGRDEILERALALVRGS